ncbi:MAG: hypothetical protein WCW56_02625 [Candidatus Paceibacterota bacterium]|jgi:hypothetical protein
MFKTENDLLWVGAMIGILFFLWLFTGGPARIQSGPFIEPLAPVGTGEAYGDLSKPKVDTTQVLTGTSTTTKKQTSSQTNSGSVSSATKVKETATDIRTSRYKGLITISRGNASSENRSTREYISLRGSSKITNPINISGWTLKNGNSSKTYEIGSNVVKGQSATAKIPNAVLVWKKNLPMTVVPIKMAANQTVYLVSGSPQPIGGYQIKDSFRVNKCMGYIANQTGYSNIFYPSLSTNCPKPMDEPGVNTLYQQCYDYIRTIGTCRKPDLREDWCRANYAGSAINTTVCKLPTTCKNFIKARYNYEACVVLHSTDEDFLKGEWRAYLGSVWEIWASSRETITLYDSTGQIVDQIKY